MQSDPSKDHDDTDMTDEEFERAFANGTPVDVVTSRQEYDERLLLTAHVIGLSSNMAEDATSTYSVTVGQAVATVLQPQLRTNLGVAQIGVSQA